jgi:hypothetical protein
MYGRFVHFIVSLLYCAILGPKPVVILYYHRRHKLPYYPRYIAKGLTVEKTLSERSPTEHALLYRLTTKNWGLHNRIA